MKVRWTPEAEHDRAAVVETIAFDSPRAAARMDGLFSEAAANLARFPKMGPVGKIAGTRELLPHPSYRLIYETEGEIVWILALVHTARQWPPVLES